MEEVGSQKLGILEKWNSQIKMKGHSLKNNINLISSLFKTYQMRNNENKEQLINSFVYAAWNILV